MRRVFLATAALVAACFALPALDAVAQDRALPDLTVQSHTVTGNIVEAVITNTGRAGAQIRTTATLYIYANGSRHSPLERSIPALGAGESINLAFPLPAIAGTYQVMADSKRELTESDETNNRTNNAAFGQTSGGRPDTPPRSGNFTPDPRLARTVGRYPRLVGTDGTPAPVAAARMPGGTEVLFIENELVLISNNPADAQSVADRWRGKILETTRPRGGDFGTLYLIRVDTSQPADVALDEREQQTPFSSTAARNLLTIAKAEKALGLKIGVNPIGEGAAIADGKTSEANGANAMALDYMKAGGPFDVDVAMAWQMLDYANGFANKISIGILDNGFGLDYGGFTENDIVIAGSSDAGSKNAGLCGESTCPWHGLNSAEAAGGIPNDNRGMAGPAGPVAQMYLWDRGNGGAAHMASRLESLRSSGARIINMSFSGVTERDPSFWDGAWLDSVEYFENITRYIATHDNRLLFASAGNKNINVDARNGDGDESQWIFPCENQGVLCVGGWSEITPGSDPNTAGGGSAPKSNYSYMPNGETVDIYGPWCTSVGDNPDTPGATVTESVCGTSFSSPFVSGVAALIWSANPSLSAGQVWGLMSKHATSKGTIRRVHAAGAVREALMSTGQKFAPRVELTAKTQGTFSQGSSIQLSHTDFDIEDGEACCAAKWYVDGKEVFSIKPNNSSPILKTTGLAAGSHTLKLTVTDTDGLSVSQQTSFTVTNAPPKILIEAPVGGIYTALPYEFRAVVTDDAFPFPLGGAECDKVKWTVDVAGMTPANPTGCSVVLRFANLSNPTLTVKYTDMLGLTTTATHSFSVIQTAGMTVAITKPLENHAFTSEEEITYTAESANFKGIPYFAWTLTDVASNVTRPLPPHSGNDPFFRLSDIFPEYKFHSSSRQFVLAVTAKSTQTKSTGTASVRIVQLPYIK